MSIHFSQPFLSLIKIIKKKNKRLKIENTIKSKGKKERKKEKKK